MDMEFHKSKLVYSINELLTLRTSLGLGDVKINTPHCSVPYYTYTQHTMHLNLYILFCTGLFKFLLCFLYWTFHIFTVLFCTGLFHLYWVFINTSISFILGLLNVLQWNCLLLTSTFLTVLLDYTIFTLSTTCTLIDTSCSALDFPDFYHVFCTGLFKCFLKVSYQY